MAATGAARAAARACSRGIASPRVHARRTLALGDAVRLQITGPCPRCVMTTLPQGDLPMDPGILRAAAQHNQANGGVYAAVLHGGTVRRGDAVKVG